MEKQLFRELTFEQLFLTCFYSQAETENECRLFLEDHDLLQELELIGDKALTPAEITALKDRSALIYKMIPELDQQIDAVSENWKTSRMPRIDLSILRLALYEMNYDEKIPAKVAINEAVELAKKYGDKNSSAFINAILGKLYKE